LIYQRCTQIRKVPKTTTTIPLMTMTRTNNNRSTFTRTKAKRNPNTNNIMKNTKLNKRVLSKELSQKRIFSFSKKSIFQAYQKLTKSKSSSSVSKQELYSQIPTKFTDGELSQMLNSGLMSSLIQDKTS
jgi:response regulator RpfG family c-di-GMP phosphodiesterase